MHYCERSDQLYNCELEYMDNSTVIITIKEQLHPVHRIIYFLSLNISFKSDYNCECGYYEARE